MTATDSIARPRILVAIDIAKAKHEVLVELPTGKRKKMIVRNQLSDFRQLAGYLKRLDGAPEIALEPTADYHRNLAYFLKVQGFQVKLVSSIAVARTREALHNSWDKNDPKDALVILHLLRNGNTQYFYDPVIERNQRSAGAVEDPLPGFVAQDSRATQSAQPLSTALLSRGRAVPVQ